MIEQDMIRPVVTLFGPRFHFGALGTARLRFLFFLDLVAAVRCEFDRRVRNGAPALRFHLFEDAAGVTGRDPAVAAALWTPSAKRDVLSAVGADDHKGV